MEVKCFSRTTKEIKPVLAEKKADTGKVIYDVCRGAELKKDKQKAARHKLRYDITYLYPESLGKELSKTFGHYHNGDYPEIMEVISGKAWFLLQRHGKNPKNISEAYLVEAKENEKIITPPKFGHLSINPSKTEILILSNWESLKEKSDYKPYQKFHGGCYYFIRGKKGIKILKNKYYGEVPKLIRLKPKEIPELGLTCSKSLYSLIKTPEKLAFLNNPKKIKKILTIKNCYKKI